MVRKVAGRLYKVNSTSCKFYFFAYSSPIGLSLVYEGYSNWTLAVRGTKFGYFASFKLFNFSTDYHGLCINSEINLSFPD